jgi:hypothetical protein
MKKIGVNNNYMGKTEISKDMFLCRRKSYRRGTGLAGGLENHGAMVG